MKRIGIISLSNGLNENQKVTINKLKELLKSINIETIESSTLYAVNGPFSGSGEERAIALMNLYTDNTIDAIFDVSGGDLANEVLPYIDFDLIKENYKPFVGYSDLSVILNSIFSQTGKTSYLYQIRNIVNDDSKAAYNHFITTFLEEKYDITTYNYKWIQGSSMKGVLIGGNLRCNLKLSGTKYMPDFNDSILLIESLGGDVAKISTYLTQYKLMGAFEKINGIILGQFTEMEKNNLSPSVEELIIKIVDNPLLPIVKTSDIGHSVNSKSLIIGSHIELNK